MPASVSIIKKAEEANASFIAFSKSHNIPSTHFSFIETDAHPAVVSACRKLKILHKPFQSFLDDLKNVLYPLGRMDTPLCSEFSNNDLANTARYSIKNVIIWNKDHTQAKCFPNLLFSTTSIDTLYVPHFLNENPLFPEYSGVIKTKIESDIKEGRVSAWSPVSRGIKRLGQRRTQTISSVLSRYVLFDGKPFSTYKGGGQIVDFISSKMLDLHKPTTFSFADTLEEMRDMYKVGSSETPTSCMDNGHRFYLKDSNNNSVRPVDFYVHCSITRGACLKRGDVVLARTICWHDKHNDQWYFGRLYANRSAYMDKLKTELKRQGFLELDGEYTKFPDYKNAPNVVFQIPTCYTESGDTASVMPYFDRMPFYQVSLEDRGKQGWDCLICFNEIRRATLSGWENPDIRATCGYHRSGGNDEENEDSYVYCADCDNEIHNEDAFYVDDVGESFCNLDCANEYNIITLVQSTTSRHRFIHQDTLNANFEGSIRAFGQHVYFSNYNAAVVNNNVGIYRPSLFAESEVPYFCYGDGNPPSLAMEYYGQPTAYVGNGIFSYRCFREVPVDNGKINVLTNKTVFTNMDIRTFTRFCNEVDENGDPKLPEELPIDTLDATSTLVKSFTNKPYPFVKIKQNKETLLEYNLDKENNEILKIFHEHNTQYDKEVERLLRTPASLKYFIINTTLTDGDKK